MPEEIRRIRFTFGETTKALQNYAEKTDTWIPDGSINRARIGQKAQHEVHTMRSGNQQILKDQNIKNAGDDIIITFFDEQTLEHNYANLSKAYISAALIEHCIQQQILLPKEAQKSIDLDELHFCLDIHYKAPSEDDGPILSLDEE